MKTSLEIYLNFLRATSLLADDYMLAKDYEKLGSLLISFVRIDEGCFTEEKRELSRTKDNSGHFSAISQERLYRLATRIRSILPKAQIEKLDSNQDGEFTTEPLWLRIGTIDVNMDGYLKTQTLK